MWGVLSGTKTKTSRSHPSVCGDKGDDGLLTLSEVLDKMDYVRTSTITDYGAMRVEDHEEL
ncbi:unnamed protein product [Menidia menidia]|uniref:(Atlantic silverside) hypothetical protein n=1 Tax=Menidia menidia TaxID=238744 RepID=A0A8S4AUJ5_9TELE|nr:unnamed protein product [Menidia menidia]